MKGQKSIAETTQEILTSPASCGGLIEGLRPAQASLARPRDLPRLVRGPH